MVSRVMEWRDRLIEKGLNEEIADELVLGLPEQLASAEDVRALERHLERVEATLSDLQLEVARMDERFKGVERAIVDLREEMRAVREEMRAMRDEFNQALQNERADRRTQFQVLVAVILAGLAANSGIVAALITLLD